MKSRRARIARLAPALHKRPGEEPRKVHSGDNPIEGWEWKNARTQMRYTQRELGEALDIHWNTVARRERDEQSFAHPAMARLALMQMWLDYRANVSRDMPPGVPISGAEWRVYREGLGMTVTEFGAALDSHTSTVSDWEGDVVSFQHPNLARLAARMLFTKAGIPFPSVKIRKVKVL